MMQNRWWDVIQYSTAGLALIISGGFFIAYCSNPNLTPEMAARSALAERFLTIRDEGPDSSGNENYSYIAAGTKGVFTDRRGSVEQIRDVLSRRLIVLEEQKQEDGEDRLTMKIGDSLHCKVKIPRINSEFWLVSFGSCSDKNTSDHDKDAYPKGSSK